MIFVTVGEQLPFDRLIRAIDEWAGTSKKEIFAQVGRSGYIPKYISCKNFLTLEEFKDKFMTAELIVAHAGMGTIISALENNKPILVMPRQAILGEHRNEHQYATAKRFSELNYILVAYDDMQLKAYLEDLEEIINHGKRRHASGPSPLLIKTIRDFIEVK
jgi:UDP-N-acetylglucosamine transferase subunit ALG13